MKQKQVEASCKGHMMRDLNWSQESGWASLRPWWVNEDLDGESKRHEDRWGQMEIHVAGQAGARG